MTKNCVLYNHEIAFKKTNNDDRILRKFDTEIKLILRIPHLHNQYIHMNTSWFDNTLQIIITYYYPVFVSRYHFIVMNTNIINHHYSHCGYFE